MTSMPPDGPPKGMQVRFPFTPPGLSPLEIATSISAINNMYELLYQWAEPKYATRVFPQRIGNRRSSFLDKNSQLQVQALRYGSPLEIAFSIDIDIAISLGVTGVNSLPAVMRECFEAAAAGFGAVTAGAEAVTRVIEMLERIRAYWRDNDHLPPPPSATAAHGLRMTRLADYDRFAGHPLETPSKRATFGEIHPDELLQRLLEDCQRVMNICGPAVIQES